MIENQFSIEKCPTYGGAVPRWTCCGRPRLKEKRKKKKERIEYNKWKIEIEEEPLSREAVEKEIEKWTDVSGGAEKENVPTAGRESERFV